ncbi:alpha-(1,3)-fucosyltransferase C-like [Zerene cesonia]|uniref:alpha-(1,3)-fucosyltransferase C-like n=1 Tax=Zerene cesonia TaxID=33412 RepID=UPI0018E4E550|nr:alpha-(1,3)-fucosyltransferase C-like [Zerene cesonia]
MSIDEGQKLLEEHQCPYTNCYVTTNKNLLNGDYTQFDAIVYNISSISNWNKDLAKNRSVHQKFVFHSVQSSEEYPVCNVFTDDYFNLTWTYKLDSDIVSPFLEVRDLEGNVVAPKQDVKWNVSLHNINDSVKERLRNKRRAMMWIVDTCDTSNSRLDLAKQMQSLFRKNFLDFDIYGCDMFECPDAVCYRIIEKYYFYFVAEDSNAVDYVTAEVLKAYKNYAVPVVYGGADYKKFLPTGSYINLNSTSMDGIVALLEYIMKNPEVYYTYHRWRTNYIFKKTKALTGICGLCAKLNEWGGTKTKKDLRSWWYNKPLFNRCVPGGAESFSEVFSYVNSSRHRL